MDHLKSTFQNPPSIYRTAPLWVWNDLMTEQQIAFQLNELKSHGFGGAFVHPRPGLITDYLSDEWFAIWGFALKTAKQLGLKLYIYDENSYPSGFAGGHVSAALPDCLAQGATYSIVDLCGDEKGQNSPYIATGIIAAYSCREDDGRITLLGDLTAYPANEWAQHGGKAFVVTLAKPATTGWLAGFAFTDLLRPEVHEQFISTTYNAYYERFGEDFGDAIPAIFTDEPYISASSVYGQGPRSLPFSYWLVNQFEMLNGYSLLANLPAIFKDVQGDVLDHPAEKVRYDYYKTIHALWTKNSIEPTGRWCAEHNINWTGHYLEHQWPHVGVNTSPSMQSFYEYHQWPAIDMLLSNYLRDTPSHALALTIQEIRSAANQFGKERTLCELYGAGGWDSTFDDYKRMGDWILVNGINFINQHLTYATIAGARKRDHPQSFDWREPWWDQYTKMNDYLARASYLLSQGRMEQRILVLNPSTTGYLTPYEEEQGGIFSGAGVDSIKNPDMTGFLTMAQRLADWQWDYDYGDEYTMARHAKVDGGKLKLIEQSYDVILISGDMRNMLASTVDMLGAFMCAGGKVIAIGQPGGYVDGIIDEKAYADLAERWETCDLGALDGRLERLLGRRVMSSVALPEGVAHMRRVLADGREVYFFVNHSFETVNTALTLAGDCACEYGLYDGDVRPIEFSAEGGKVSFNLELVRNQSAMIVVGELAGTVPAQLPAGAPVEMRLKSIERECGNMLPIGYCDLKIGGRELRDINVIAAGDMVYSERGFEKNPWDNKVQYKNNLMDKNPIYGQGTGFEVTYRFTVADGFAPAKIDVTAEQYTMCRLRANGVDVPWSADEHFLDEHFGTADISALVVSGENEITIVVDRFDVRMEVESIYLRGEFDVAAANGKWVLTPPEDIRYGAWKDQGKPFYSYAVRYNFAAALASAPETALLDIADYGATAVSAIVNGTEVLLHADGHRAQEVAHLLRAGDNDICIRVCGSLKNLLGPHFMENPVRGSAWPGMWKQAPTHQPAPEAYDLLPLGLNAGPVLTVG